MHNEQNKKDIYEIEVNPIKFFYQIWSRLARSLFIWANFNDFSLPLAANIITCDASAVYVYQLVKTSKKKMRTKLRRIKSDTYIYVCVHSVLCDLFAFWADCTSF